LQESEEWRTEAVRRLLWSARNHLEAAQAKVEGEYDTLDPVTPSKSLSPFERQEVAIHTGTASEHLLKALIMSAPTKVRSPRKLPTHQLFPEAENTFPDVQLHKTAINEVNKVRNFAIHDGTGPDRVTTIRIVRATEELAGYVIKELRTASNPVLEEFRAFDDFRWSEAASRAMDALASDVHARIKAAADTYASRFGKRDAEEFAALLELDREGWLAAADSNVRHVDRECPACKYSGFVLLTMDHVVVGSDIVEYAHAHRFFCVACGLDLEHSDWPFAGITDTYSDPDPELFD
jgi:hypothetical protein